MLCIVMGVGVWICPNVFLGELVSESIHISVALVVVSPLRNARMVSEYLSVNPPNTIVDFIFMVFCEKKI